jgi:hypothetical protein
MRIDILVAVAHLQEDKSKKQLTIFLVFLGGPHCE